VGRRCSPRRPPWLMLADRVRPRGGARSDPRKQAGPRRNTPEIAFRWRATKGN